MGYWVVSECCLDIMEGVWKEYQMCLESTCKVSGSCKKDFLSQKLTNVKKKRTFWAKKPSWGYAYEQKKDFWAKELTNKKKEKNYFFGQKNKLGLSLRRKKGFLGAKIVEKIEYKGQKLIN